MRRLFCNNEHTLTAIMMEACHASQDKFYFVVEGQGTFVVGTETSQAGPGMVIWAPAGVDHGVTNTSAARLVLLVGIAPAP
jgi:mannose-6-phosphate isomerase-like protein (cupin superfamily)